MVIQYLDGLSTGRHHRELHGAHPDARKAIVTHTTRSWLDAIDLDCTALWRWIGALLLVLASLSISDRADALPQNFRNVDIFYVGAMPDRSDIDELADLGIHHIVSLHRMPPKVIAHAKRLGLEVHDYPWRTRLERVEEIMTILEQATPNTVFIHCMHGADRTGAVTAYWLHTRRDYDPFLALATVISPRSYHLRGLEMLAYEYDYDFRVIDKQMFGRFSGARNGGLEGLKLRGGRWYTRLARNYLELTIGPPLRKPIYRFWNRTRKRSKTAK